jgi:hypothetical protein
VGVKASLSLAWDVSSWTQEKTTAETHCKNVVGRQFLRANKLVFAGDHPAMDMTNTDNDLEM